MDNTDMYDPKQHIMDAAEQWDGWSTSDSETEAKDSTNHYNLSLGWPVDGELPNELILKSTQRILSKTNANALNYGDDLGDDFFLTQLSEFLSKTYQHPIPKSNLMVTGGASQALDLCCTQIKSKGSNKVVFVENPTYFLAQEVIKTHGFEIIGIETDEGGVILSDLERKVEAHGKPAFLYIIPTHHNPTGRTMPLDRRDELKNYCEREQIMIVADEVYQFLSWSDEKVKSFGEYDSDVVVSISSFTKILSPGLRVGWINSTPSNISLLHDAGVIRSGGALSNFTAQLVADCLERGALQDYLSTLVTLYKFRSSSLHSSLVDEVAPLGVTFSKPTGGYFIWCTLPPPLTTARLIDNCPDVTMASGTPFFASQSSVSERSFRICFVRYNQPQLQAAVKRLSVAIKSLL
eukprot:TRINITY_DN4697_c0_g1_i1.p1 TRINITY_DN4697_c0_g1~~TRINITY_DN4697_c0_g1_i1.p1  ORF type:complete len:427 (+),score=71.55 TRINITY_DN4697_c0_g1_i1:62-1282(+)